MVVRGRIKISPITKDKERTYYVYLPRGYESGDRRYPVIYMFDGHNLFTDEEATYGKCWGLEDYLDAHSAQVIIAAVECNHEGDMRLSEYSPVPFEFHGRHVVGRGKKYMDWLCGEFKPFIDGNFPTLPERENTYIAGSSMGGLMTIYALAAYGDYFRGGAALSPSLWVGGGELPPFVRRGKYGKDCVLFMGYGEKEFGNHIGQRSRFAEAFKALCEKGVNVTARISPGGAHNEASWEKEIPYFMSVLGFGDVN